MKYFSLTNDPDHGLVDDYRPVLRSLADAGIFVTTAVFCTLKDDGTPLSRHCNRTETHTLDNNAYCKLMKEAKAMGHEIAFHGYSQVSDLRREFEYGLEIYDKVFGEYPSVYIEHGGHPHKHDMGMCKNENLAMFGSDVNSRHYIKDIVSELFDLVWTHDYLMDDLLEPLPLSRIFVERDGMTFFRRWRNSKIFQVQIPDDEKNALVGYTHFGYTGYSRRIALRRPLQSIIAMLHNDPYVENGRKIESWKGENVKVAVRELSNYLIERDYCPVTLGSLYEISKRTVSIEQ